MKPNRSYENLIEWLEENEADENLKDIEYLMSLINNKDSMSDAAQKRIENALKRRFGKVYKYRYVRTKPSSKKGIRIVKGKDKKYYYFRKKRFKI